MNIFILKQFPVLPPNVYTLADINFIAPRVLELVFNAYDLRPFAEEMSYHGEPFRWDEERRALLRAELDAYYAKLYRLTRDELRYILDPQDVYGTDFPGETFRVLKEKELRQYCEHRTRRLVLEAWERLDGMEIGVTPKVGDPADAQRSTRAANAPAAKPVEAVDASKGPASVKRTEPARAGRNAAAQPEAQPGLGIDFGLYQCGTCKKLVMGFDQEKHKNEAHGGKPVAWKKVK